MADQPSTPVYGNVFKLTRTPWDVTLFVYNGATPPDAKPGTVIDLSEGSDPVAVVTMPLEVGRLLIKALQQVTQDAGIILNPKPKEPKPAKEGKNANSRR